MSALLAAALEGLAARIVPERIERVWLFPSRQLRERESGLAVLALYPQGEVSDREQRQLLTLRYEATREHRGMRRLEELIEEGSAPAERIERVIAGVLRRLGDAPEAPRAVWIGGEPRRWTQLLAEAASAALDRHYGE